MSVYCNPTLVPPRMVTPDFFIDDPDLLTRFESWLQQKGIRASTHAVYRGMLERLVQWARLAGRVPTLTEAMLESFLATRELSPMSRHRYLLLLSAWLEFESACRRGDCPEEVNPARRLLLEKTAPEPDPPQVLADETREALLKGLDSEARARNWKHARTAGAMSVMLGCGLTAREIVLLQLDDVLESPAFCALRVRPNGLHAERVVPFVDPAPLDVFKRWLKCRATCAIPGNLVFPGTLAGGPLVHSTLYRCVTRTSVKLAGEEACPVILRNTFARWAASTGASQGQVQLWMGHVHARATGRILGVP